MIKKFREFVAENFKSPDEEHAKHVRNAEESQKKADAHGDNPHLYHSHMADHYDHLHKATTHILANHPHPEAGVRAIQRKISDDNARKAKIHRELADEHK